MPIETREEKIRRLSVTSLETREDKIRRLSTATAETREAKIERLSTAESPSTAFDVAKSVAKSTFKITPAFQIYKNILKPYSEKIVEPLAQFVESKTSPEFRRGIVSATPIGQAIDLGGKLLDKDTTKIKDALASLLIRVGVDPLTYIGFGISAVNKIKAVKKAAQESAFIKDILKAKQLDKAKIDKWNQVMKSKGLDDLALPAPKQITPKLLESKNVIVEPSTGVANKPNLYSYTGEQIIGAKERIPGATEKLANLGVGRRETPKILYGAEASAVRGVVKPTEAFKAQQVAEVEEGVNSILRGKPLEQLGTFRESARASNINYYKKTKNFLRDQEYSNVRPENIFWELDGFKEGANTRNAFNPVYNGWIKYVNSSEKSIKNVEAIINPMIRNPKFASQRFETASFKGSESFTKDMAAYVYAQSKNKFGLTHLKGSGLGDKEISEIVGVLSDAEKISLNQILRYNSESLWNKLAPTYNKVTGKQLGRQENYLMIRGLDDMDSMSAIELDSAMRASESVNVSKLDVPLEVKEAWQKARVGGTQGFKNFSFIGAQYNTWHKAEQYTNMAEGIKHSSDYLINPKIAGAIKQKYGEYIYKDVLKGWLDDVAYGMPRETNQALDKISKVARVNLPISYLGFNVMSMAKQSPSVILAGRRASELGAGTFSVEKGLMRFMTRPIKTIREVQNKSTFMRARNKRIEVEIQDLFFGRNSLVVNKSLNQKVAEVSMEGILTIDRSVTSAAWKGIFDDLITRGVSEAQAIKTADKVIRDTQPISGVINLPKSFRVAGAQKAANLFRNQLNQNFNRLRESWRELPVDAKVRGVVKAGGRLMVRQLMYNSVPALMIGYMKRRRTPTPQEFARDFALQYSAGLSIWGNIADVFLSDFVGNQGLTVLDGIVNDVNRAVKSKDLKKGALLAGQAAARLARLPVTGAKRIFERQILGKPRPVPKGQKTLADIGRDLIN